MNCLADATHGNMSLMTPDYGRGAEWVCYHCDPNGRRFVDASDESRRRSMEARAESAANAEDLACEELAFNVAASLMSGA